MAIYCQTFDHGPGFQKRSCTSRLKAFCGSRYPVVPGLKNTTSFDNFVPFFFATLIQTCGLAVKTRSSCSVYGTIETTPAPTSLCGLPQTFNQVCHPGGRSPYFPLRLPLAIGRGPGGTAYAAALQEGPLSPTQLARHTCASMCPGIPVQWRLHAAQGGHRYLAVNLQSRWCLCEAAPQLGCQVCSRILASLSTGQLH